MMAGKSEMEYINLEISSISLVDSVCCVLIFSVLEIQFLLSGNIKSHSTLMIRFFCVSSHKSQFSSRI